MSDICGRRRLAKLAFVTGASGNLRGFLEEPVHTNYNYRLTDPFAFHAAFLEERLRMQGEGDEEQGSPAVQPGEPAVQQAAAQAAAAEVEKAFDALMPEFKKFIDSPGLLDALKLELTEKSQMKDFMDAWSKIDENRKRRIGKRVESGSVIQSGLEMPSKDSTMEEKVDNLRERILGFKKAPNQAGLDNDGSTVLHTQKDDGPTFDIGKEVQEIVDRVSGKFDEGDQGKLKMSMYELLAVALLKFLRFTPPTNEGGQLWEVIASDADSYKKEKVKVQLPEGVYVKRKSGVVMEELRAIRDNEGQKIITGLRLSTSNMDLSAKELRPESIALALCKYLYNFTPLISASANGEKSHENVLATAQKFFPNAFINGIDLQVNLEKPWSFKVGEKDDTFFRIDLSRLEEKDADGATKEKAKVFTEKITQAGDDKNLMEKITKKLINAVKEAVKKDIDVFSVPAKFDELSQDELNVWRTAQETVKGFLEERVKFINEKAGEDKQNPVGFFNKLKDANDDNVNWIGKLLASDIPVEGAGQQSSESTSSGPVSPEKQAA